MEGYYGSSAVLRIRLLCLLSGVASNRRDLPVAVATSLSTLQLRRNVVLPNSESHVTLLYTQANLVGIGVGPSTSDAHRRHGQNL